MGSMTLGMVAHELACHFGAGEAASAQSSMGYRVKVPDQEGANQQNDFYTSLERSPWVRRVTVGRRIWKYE
jgi:hypothetical protein